MIVFDDFLRIYFYILKYILNYLATRGNTGLLALYVLANRRKSGDSWSGYYV